MLQGVAVCVLQYVSVMLLPPVSTELKCISCISILGDVLQRVAVCVLQCVAYKMYQYAKRCSASHMGNRLMLHLHGA